MRRWRNGGVQVDFPACRPEQTEGPHFEIVRFQQQTEVLRFAQDDMRAKFGEYRCEVRPA